MEIKDIDDQSAAKAENTGALRTGDDAAAEQLTVTEAPAVTESAAPAADCGAGQNIPDAVENSDVESVPESYEIIGVRFKKSGKIYYFDPDGVKAEKDASVIVETARGIEFGSAVIANRMVSAKDVVLPLRKVIRLATPEDEEHKRENTLKETQAYNICIEKIEAHRLAMKLVDVEYTFDNNKLLFYFTADGRIDFRELVKDLASVFRTRIELRQIGIRDEAKMMGGLGICGRPFCCHSFLSDFVQVSIKMAKEQNLSLNSAKISGACGRLMCCLRYEYDTYDDELRNMPGMDALVRTPDGDGFVTELNPLARLIRVRLKDSPETQKVYDSDAVVRIRGGVRLDEEPAAGDAELEKLERIEKTEVSEESGRTDDTAPSKP
ncbi:MAG: stage 0 sporulation family protein, partial [Eubacteriales bacterium]